MTKILVTGSSGQLGHDIANILAGEKYQIIAPTHEEMDIVNSQAVKTYLSTHKPDLIIHCAAWTNVDLAEDKEYECRLVNVQGTKNLVDYCMKNCIPLMYFSTDYVFDGNGEKPWDVNDPTNPQNAYGLSKRDGELLVKKLDKHFIIRISWVFGINGKNFVKTMINLSKSKNELSIVSDQIGSPTYTEDLAVLVSEMIGSEKYGTYHACNQGYCSWYEFAKKIFEYINSDIIVKPIDSKSWPSKVKRPNNSRLNTSSLTLNGFHQLPHWEDALKRFIDQMNS